jgi:hypothetical protein
MILQLDSTKSDPPISGAPACLESNIDLLEVVQEYSALGVTPSSTRIHGGDSNKVQGFPSLG